MHTQTLAHLRCVETRRQHGDSRQVVCGGELIQRDELTLVCGICDHEFAIIGGVPIVLPPDSRAGTYGSAELLRGYVELQFAPFLRSAQLVDRITFATPEIRQTCESGGASKFTEIARFAAAADQDFVGQTQALVSDPLATEHFYRFILDLVSAHCPPSGSVVDLGCALGRMAAEMTTFGLRHVLAVDSSERMITEARRILRAQQPITTKLNLLGGRTLPVHVDLDGTTWKPERIDFLVADAQLLPLATGSFDFGLLLNVLDRVADPQQVARELARVLRAGARLIVTMPYDWDEQVTPRFRWVSDVTTLFDGAQWRRVEEVDALPFAVRVGHPRRLTVYMTQCLVYERCGDD